MKVNHGMLLFKQFVYPHPLHGCQMLWSSLAATKFMLIWPHWIIADMAEFKALVSIAIALLCRIVYRLLFGTLVGLMIGRMWKFDFWCCKCPFCSCYLCTCGPDASVVHTSGSGQLQANPHVVDQWLYPGKPAWRAVTMMGSNELVVGEDHMLGPSFQWYNWQTGKWGSTAFGSSLMRGKTLISNLSAVLRKYPLVEKTSGNDL